MDVSFNLSICPPTEGEGGHIVFGGDPVCVGVSVIVSVGVSVSVTVYRVHDIS